MISRLFQRLCLPGLVAAAMMLLLTACALPFDSERQYISSIASHAQRTLSTLNTLQRLLGEPQLDNQEWVNQVERETETLRGLIEEARRIEPPEQFANFHQSYMDMVGNLEQLAITVEQGLALRNNQMVQQGQQLTDQGLQRVDELRERVLSLSSQFLDR
jgi:Mg2+ and Co2+ transporter CorA